MKKRFIALILLICMALSVFQASAADETDTEAVKMNFIDVNETHPAYKEILYLFENEIINGKSDTMFAPDDFIKREELAKILSLGFKLTDIKNAPVFYDVPIGTWYAQYVQLVGATGFMKGISYGPSY